MGPRDAPIALTRCASTRSHTLSRALAGEGRGEGLQYAQAPSPALCVGEGRGEGRRYGISMLRSRASASTAARSYGIGR